MKKIHVRDIILIALIAIIFAVIYVASDNVYNFLTVLLSPIGYGSLANDITMGIWCMAGPVAGFLVRLPLSGFLGEFLGAALETFMMAQWGAANLLSGLIQGFGSELGFTLTGYKVYNTFTLFLSATTTTIITFLYDFFKNGYNQYPVYKMFIYFGVRWISMIIFCCILVKLITNLLEKAHIIKNAQD
ncbi:energy-coupling factor transport system substrate-specific component [Lactobacillus colini]|uniref:Energy-coupling factor transport system substrate-specific component n=1 Tax=Lactobacillus colini TaxID=1819254 RepID=A0ABS4MCS5_9LACO|nr:ECF transporter S component [Lactobacillus colini]MBP2057489.1 energy-coupling factor transport system substrate-specific component [Lactobacillus colini]